MHRCLFRGIVGLVALCVTASAFGQTGASVDIKSPPLRDSEVWTLPVDFHPSVDIPNFAGVLMKMHVADATEVDVDKIIPVLDPTGTAPPYDEPFGPQSQNQQSVTKWFTAWDPNAQQSGIDLPASQNIHAFDIQLRAKNTDAQNNSDIDLTAMVWNIRHLRDTPANSQIITLQPSDWAYGFPGQDPLGLSELPTQNPEPGQGVWYHVDPAEWPDGKRLHLTANIPGSFFYATQVLAGTAWRIGIEHIPEPVGISLMLSGVGAVGAATLCRRRRKRA